MQNYKCCLSIAGSDSSAGAGIQADLKTFSALGCYSASVITALTAQNTTGVQAVKIIEPTFIAQQLKSVFDDIDFKAIKIGMLANAEVINTITPLLPKMIPIVLDPVMISSNGDRLLEDSAIEALKKDLMPKASIVTPNRHEAEILSGLAIHDKKSLFQAADKIHGYYSGAILIKGGHFDGLNCDDYLFLKNDILKFSHPRIKTQNTHGTGCSLSAAIAAYLAKGQDLPTAVNKAVDFVHSAVVAGKDYQLGSGIGPIHHFHQWWS